ncbi:MAG: hypothetical protein GY694_14585 [Gammaproteobacteria bacterium]|nr:hypothetical protein [Gammaproteobacteria bacterium]
MSNEEVSFIEQHAITLLILILVGLGGWNLIATNQLQSSQSSNYEELKGKLNLANEKIGFLRDNFNIRTMDRYTSADASRDKTVIMSEINMLKLRLNSHKATKLHNTTP